MRIRKWIAVTAALLLTVLAGTGTAEGGVTLRTISCFAGLDGSADEYVAILQHYESMTGNTVIDNSSIIDEAWKTAILKDFAAGNEPDILFFFAAGADSAPILSRVVSLEEINADYPDMNLPEADILREPDGKVYAVPVRGYWEGLYVHTDLFELYHAPLPTDWDSLMEAIRIFRENDIIPIAVSLSDIPHYLAEMSLLACASKEDLAARPKTFEEVPASWLEAMSLIRELAEAGAFADNAWSTYETASTNLFLTKKAAMQMDGSWLESSFSYGMMDTLRVLPMPLRNGEGVSDCYLGGVSMGFYLTRRAWESGRRDAAVALLKELTSEESIRELGSSSLSGRLLDSAKDMQTGRQMVSPLQDAMNSKAREVWLLECIPAVAEGTMTPEECWRRVMSLAPFGE
ncbi:ABC transporter substrate-binding protein [Aristaeella hokkaidonensis]|uniref:Carbohydrate ABC transporter substrate-binding protein n=1 Tax=Aristaeella hokkaidonensis TaxID=3046382 RepID=A0AC61MWM9_9FIRM|nr:ABC transporter substrate-binding protein [Aristaeella hokkaidonensis]QUC65863.1 carbohydrate ABC transporter substrate-binding protein [Aristaeella hokkaidonensis]SNT93924.1 raffinose/stachyose/melibiose transport system substrate-binding protein [Aristaeella hokkaidonensis]